MPARSRNLASDPDRRSFLEELYQGRFRWDLIRPFPQQDPVDRKKGDAAVAGLGDFFHGRLDPTEVDEQAAFPAQFTDALRAQGYLKLQADTGLGGHELSCLNTFRVIEAAASRCFPAAVLMGIENSLGAGALLPIMPPGPLADRVARQVRSSGLSGSADTEPSGAANQGRTTTAVPVEDGAAYVLNGHKVQVVNAPEGELFTVTAAVRGEDGETRNRLFVVDADTPGFSRGGSQALMGMKGLPFGWITLNDVRVPAERLLVEAESEHTSRLTPAISRLVVRGRLYIIAAPSLAVSRLCLDWMREFVGRRRIDGRDLGEYEEIQRRLADCRADTYALESVAMWSLLGIDNQAEVNLLFEQNSAKNICSLLGWRVVETTMSVLAGEGYETAGSKAARGVTPSPVERAFRDMRGLRITGGVDFLLDNWTAARTILSYYYPDPDPADDTTAGPVLAPELCARNAAHLDHVADGIRRFGEICRDLTRRHPDRAALVARERLMILLNQIATELLTMALSLARAASQSETDPGAQDLADLYCSAGRLRLADLHHRLSAHDTGDEPDFARVADAWLAEEAPAAPLHAVSADVREAGR
ncbi:acyl-CoA dehydrogenase family protein [Streptomyces sp. NBC_00728]|uniref:acyl-CoA dehydrogenase family protein n=1 Tax=Streptomyces sp. NBC_00728 TaxID=2903676 RepID=UPI00387018C7